MITGPLPDLAATLRLQRDAGAVRASLERAGRELSTGKKEDLFAASGGDPRRLLAIEGSQARAAREAETVVLAQGRLSLTQSVMGGLQGLADGLGPELAAAVARGDMNSARIHAAGAEDAFRNAVQNLNTTYAGRTLFSGAAVDTPALDDPDLIFADVAAVVAGAADAADAIAQVETYFDVGGGFDARFLGAVEDAPRAGIDSGDSVDISRRADDPEVRELLRGLAIAAVTVDSAYAGPADAQGALFEEAAAVTMSARESLVQSRALLGLSEQALEDASVRIAARKDTLDLAWNHAVSRDPYDAAAEFQAIEQQLQRVFLVTSRLSQLSLTDFLR
ncbi:flagellin [Albimonas sp. CAU 1670]|uniref:flagellin n=1 Tax=Albimonas sp. CAU 1670 TaxID=3032599 RepID=UPI0023DA32AD|nr:flagellin [Albimonas sp. CAU 1670]MDF2231118.1 flagellin [Albimonas sp. CAU 1670]